jgi:tetratricopeptide (TPR) repeat protein
MPELVFVSCGHTAAREQLAVPTSQGRFATAFAEELLALGTRCVVVTGLTVNEDAAISFVSTFYASLASGTRFVDAVATARATAYALDDMTWAAYQCYGDPEWRLRPDREAAPSDAAFRDDFSGVASTNDLVLALETVAVNRRLNRGLAVTHSESLLRLEKFGVRSGHQSQVAERFGRAWAEVGDIERAIAWFDRALATSDGEASSRVAEQRGNLRMRLALTTAENAQRARDHAVKTATSNRARTAAERTLKQTLNGARRLVERSLDEFKALARERPTLERLSLFGAAYKRLARIENLAGRRKKESEALEGMRKQFYAAEEIARTSGIKVHFSALNRMAAELALNAGRSGWKGIDSASIDRARRSAGELTTDDPDFWSVAALTELKLFEAISGRKLALRRASIEQEFEAIHARVGVTGLWMLVYDDARFVLDKYAGRAAPRERHAAVGLLNHLEAFTREADASPAE